MILIDADLIVYRCGFAAERMHYFVNGDRQEDKRQAKALVAALQEEGLPCLYYEERVLEPIENALQMVRSSLTNTIDACSYFGEAKLFLTADGGENFRNEVATLKEYKGNRKDARKPHWYNEIRQYLVDHWDAEVVDGQEADDAIGIAAYSDYKLASDLSIIVSIDKDLDMIPGFHYNWVKEETYFIDDLTAMRNFYTQLLTGDATDNIPGVKGVGPVKAAKLLEGLYKEKDMHYVCLDLYEQYFEDYLEVIKEVATLLWIRREPDEMWEPFKYEI